MSRQSTLRHESTDQHIERLGEQHRHDDDFSPRQPGFGLNGIRHELAWGHRGFGRLGLAQRFAEAVEEDLDEKHSDDQPGDEAEITSVREE
jgi:hypothetical protein